MMRSPLGKDKYPSDIYLGVIMIVLVIEGARRAMGWPLPIMAILYSDLWCFRALYARYSCSRRLLFTKNWLRSCICEPTGSLVFHLECPPLLFFLFVLFGSFLSTSGAGQFFIDLAVGLAGRARADKEKHNGQRIYGHGIRKLMR